MPKVIMFSCNASSDIYTLSLHDALPIFDVHVHTFEHARIVTDVLRGLDQVVDLTEHGRIHVVKVGQDRKSTRLNSSHSQISYAVFCLKKKSPLPELR